MSRCRVGHLLAAQSVKSARVYILGGENLSLADILGEIAQLAGAVRPC